MRANRLPLLLSFVLLTSASGCVMSLAPLSDAKTSLADPRLVGVWEEAGKQGAGKPERYRIDAVEKSTAAYRITPLAPDPRQKPMKLLVTELEKRRYMSIGGRDEEKGRDVWLIAQFEWIDEKSVRIRFLNPDAAQKEIKAGRVKGRIEKRTDESNQDGGVKIEPTWVFFDEPTDRLRTYIAANYDRLFHDEWATFRRSEPQ